jgi:hypothetical protein
MSEVGGVMGPEVGRAGAGEDSRPSATAKLALRGGFAIHDAIRRIAMAMLGQTDSMKASIASNPTLSWHRHAINPTSIRATTTTTHHAFDEVQGQVPFEIHKRNPRV